MTHRVEVVLGSAHLSRSWFHIGRPDFGPSEQVVVLVVRAASGASLSRAPGHLFERDVLDQARPLLEVAVGVVRVAVAGLGESEQGVLGPSVQCLYRRVGWAFEPVSPTAPSCLVAAYRSSPRVSHESELEQAVPCEVVDPPDSPPGSRFSSFGRIHCSGNPVPLVGRVSERYFSVDVDQDWVVLRRPDRAEHVLDRYLVG